MQNSNRRNALILLLQLVSLSACVSMPPPGERFVMVVKSIPTNRQQLQYYPGLSLALKHGVTRQDVSAGRLVRSGCYIKAEEGGSVRRRFGFTLLPDGVKAERDEIIVISAEEADGTDGPYARYFGRYIRKYNSTDADYFYDRIFGKAFRCRSISHSGEMEVAVISKVQYWDYEFAKAEESRNSEIRDEELRAGRIAIGECSPGVDSKAIWKVRIPDNLVIKVGDYIEAIAGSNERGASVGPISNAIRKVSPPSKADFIGTQGSYTVSCAAHAKPLVGN